MTTAIQTAPSSTELDELYAKLASLIDYHRKTDFPGDYSVLSSHLNYTAEYDLLMRIADGRGGARLSVDEVQKLITFSGRIGDLQSITSAFKGRYTNDGPDAFLGLLNRAYELQGGKKTAPITPKRDLTAEYSALRDTLKEISNIKNTRAATDFTSIGRSNYLHADYEMLKHFIEGRKTDLTLKEVESLLSLPGRIRNDALAKARIKPDAPSFITDYETKVVPILQRLEKALTVYTPEEQRLADGWQKFWQDHGSKIVSALNYNKNKNGMEWDTLRAKLEVFLLAARDLSVQKPPQLENYQTDLAELREVLTKRDALSLRYFAILRDGRHTLENQAFVLQQNNQKNDQSMFANGLIEAAAAFGNLVSRWLHSAKDAASKLTPSSQAAQARP